MLYYRQTSSSWAAKSKTRMEHTHGYLNRPLNLCAQQPFYFVPFGEPLGCGDATQATLSVFWMTKDSGLKSRILFFFFCGDTSNISYNLHQAPVRGLRPISSWHGVSGRGASRADTRKTGSAASSPQSLHSFKHKNSSENLWVEKGASKLCTEGSSQLELQEKEKSTLLRLIKSSDEP